VEYLKGFIDLSYPAFRHKKIQRPRTLSLLLICAGKNGGTIIGLFGVRDRIETIQALVFGGPFLDSGDDRTPGIFAFVLCAYVKLALFLVTTGVFVVISVAHGAC